MPAITLTEFVDFTQKAGQARITQVRAIKQRQAQGYHPTKDYWKYLRDAIVELHEQGSPLSNLPACVTAVHASRRANYKSSIRGYTKFARLNSPAWFSPPKTSWTSGGLSVTVNPELGLLWGGNKHAVKLYFKKAALTKSRVDVALELMHIALATTGKSPLRPVILDVGNGRCSIYTSAAPLGGPTAALLQADAQLIATLWPQV